MTRSRPLAAALALSAVFAACSDDPVRPPANDPPRDVFITWEHPFPPASIQDIWGAASNDIHAVGSRGEILHYDGNAWSLIESPTREHLTGIWGLSADHIVAVGLAGTIIRFNGERWEQEESGTAERLDDVWGSAEDSLFAVGHSATVLRYDGTSWQKMSSPPSTYRMHIWGTSGDNFYVGTEDSLYHFDGSRWTNAGIGMYVSAFSISGSSRNDIWVSEGSNWPWHYDGATWERDVTTLNYPFLDFWSIAPNNVFGSGTDGFVSHFDGTTWSERSLGDFFFLASVWASSESDAWVAGSAGQSAGVLYHFDGTDWTRTGGALADYELSDIWSDESGDHAVAVGLHGKIVGKTGGAWRAVDAVTSKDLHAVWGAPTGEVFAAGQQGAVLQFDGTEWQEIDVGIPAEFRSLWGTSKSSVYLGAFEGLWHFDGVEWDFSGIGDGVNSIWGTSESDVYIAGHNNPWTDGVIRRFDGTSWKRIYAKPMANVMVVTGYGNGELFASVFDLNSNSASIQHFDGQLWRDITPPGFNDVFTLGANPNVGLIAVVRHYDPHVYEDAQVLLFRNNQWEPLDTQYETSFLGAWGGLSNGVYLVGNASIVRCHD